MNYLGSIVLIASLFGPSANARVIAANTESHVQLIELYTSESCSSCPPADKWISTLKDRAGLWTKFVPAVFHVDYWNNLGWKDGLSSAQMTERQKLVASTWSHPAIYTPGVVLDGKEWQAWTANRIPEAANAKSPKITISEIAPGQFTVAVSGLPPGATYTVHFAKLGMGLSSEVNSGENSGLHLHHDFAVLEWMKKSLPSSGASLQFQPSTSKKAEKYAVIAWIERDGIARPLQAAGGFI